MTNNAQYCQEFIRTKKGLLSYIYSAQRLSCRRKGWQMPKYSLKELHNKFVNDAKYNYLYQIWVISNYNKWLKPSIDRINPTQHYTLSNIQMLTWKENNNKGKYENKKLTPVNIYTRNGKLIKKCKSNKEASAYLKCGYQQIVNCCMGRQKTVRNHITKYDCYPYWRRKVKKVAHIGNHIFFKE